MIQRKRTLQQSTIFVKQNRSEAHLTIEDLRNMTMNNSSSFMSELSRYVANITGSNAYWYRIREDLKAIIACKEAPTIFFTFSSADMQWPELHSLFDENSGDLNHEQRRKNVIDNPHLVDCFLQNVLKILLDIGYMKHLMLNGIGTDMNIKLEAVFIVMVWLS